MATSTRPSPSQHASQTPVGTKMIGNDGNMWIVEKDKNGTHRWVRVKSGGSSTFKRRALPSSVSKGELIMTKSGWEFYKKTLDDGRQVFTISILKETAPNRTDWQTIKNELYLNAGFKWGRFGSFERWGVIASEAMVLKTAADILGKYYQSKEEAPKKESSESPSLQEIADVLINLHMDAFGVCGIDSASDLFLSQENQKEYKAEMDKSIENFIQSGGVLYLLGVDEWAEIFDLIQDANAHSLNNYLALSGWYTEKRKDSYVDSFKNSPEWFLNPKYYTTKSEAAPTTPFTDGDFFIRSIIPDREKAFLYQVASYDNKMVYTAYIFLANRNKSGVKNFEMDDLLRSFKTGFFVLCDKDGNPLKKQAPQPKATKTFDAQEIADALMVMHDVVWNRIIIGFTAEFYKSDEKQKFYIEEMDKLIGKYSKYDLSELSEPEWTSVKDIIEEESKYVLLNYLGLRGYFGNEIVLKYNKSYKDNPTAFFNPWNFDQNSDKEEPKKENKEEPATKKDSILRVGMYFKYVSIPERIWHINWIKEPTIGVTWNRIGGNMKKVGTDFDSGTIKISDWNEKYMEGEIYEVDQSGMAISKQAAGAATKEQLETAIRGLKILADKGNEKAIAALKGLNYLLSKK